MTKTKAFLTCFFVPFSIIVSVNLFVVYGPRGGGFNIGLGFLVLLIELMAIISLFVLPIYFGRRGGVEFRKYGFYGTLLAVVLIGVFANLAHYYYKII